MERGQSVPMDAAQDVWDWEVLPDHRSFAMGHGGMRLDADQETKEPILPPPRDAAVVVDPVAESECKDIGVVPDETTKPVVAPSVADPMVPDGHGEEEKVFLQSTDAKDADDDGKFDGEEEDVKKDSRARPECVVFSVGKLKVNGIGALCSFGVAAATVCVFLIGGRLQHHHRQQQQKIQLQFYGDDKRIQQVVQQSSRLNQAMSSVMGAGASTRANISFGGFYGGF